MRTNINKLTASKARKHTVVYLPCNDRGHGSLLVVAFLRGLLECSWVQPYVFSACSPQNVFVSLVCTV